MVGSCQPAMPVCVRARGPRGSECGRRACSGGWVDADLVDHSRRTCAYGEEMGTDYSSKTNLSSKVLDFVKFGGPILTSKQNSLRDEVWFECTSKIANSALVNLSMASLRRCAADYLHPAATEDHQAADKDAYRQPNKQDGGPTGKHS